MIVLLISVLLLVAGCTLPETTLAPLENTLTAPIIAPAAQSTQAPTPAADLYSVVRIIDGDTIDVRKDGETYRVRYIGINTPERDEDCYLDATEANRLLVDGAQVRLERDISDTDRYGRWLRYVYVGEVFVNETLIRDGWAEAVLYEPDKRHYQHFRKLERDAADANRGCHASGIFKRR